MSSIRIVQDGERVTLIYDGRAIVLPHDAAIAVASELMAAGRRAAELADPEPIIRDQALVLRAGLPFGLAGHPAVQAEAAKAAQYDRDLRRYLPGGIRSKGVVGTPTLVRGPKGATNGEAQS